MICRIKEVTLLVLLYSRTRLATASPYAIGILCVLAVAKGGGYSMVGKDLSRSGIEVEETFVDRLVEANWYCSCSNIGSVLEVLGDKGDFGCISLRLFCCIRGCDYMEFGACFLFIRGPNKRAFVSCSYSCCGC